MTGPRLTVDAVRDIARLARLRFSEAELEAFTAQLGAIVEYVSALGGAEGLEGAGAEQAPGMRLREDRATHPRGFEVADLLLAGAPRRDGDLVVVPRVLDAE